MGWANLEEDIADLFGALSTARDGEEAAWMAWKRARQEAYAREYRRLRALLRRPRAHRPPPLSLEEVRARARAGMRARDCRHLGHFVCAHCGAVARLMGRRLRDEREDKRTGDRRFCSTHCRCASLSPPVTLAGRTRTLREWARFFGMRGQTVKSRINLFGWSVERALLAPSRSSAISSSVCALIGRPRGQESAPPIASHRAPARDAPAR